MNETQPDAPITLTTSEFVTLIAIAVGAGIAETMRQTRQDEIAHAPDDICAELSKMVSRVPEPSTEADAMMAEKLRKSRLANAERQRRFRERKRLKSAINSNPYLNPDPQS